MSDKAKAVLYEGRADCQFYLSLNGSAMENYKKAQKLYVSLGMKKRAAGVMESMGTLEYHESNYSEAEKLYLAAKKHFEETDDKDGLASVLEGLGVLCFELEDRESTPEAKEAIREEALEYLNQAKSLAEQSNNRQILANIYFHLGEHFSCPSDHENKISLGHYNKALKLYEIEQDSLGQGNVYRAIGNIYFLSNPKLAIENYEKSVISFRDAEMPEGYYSNVSRRINECNQHLIGLSRNDFDVDELVAKIDRKIAELEAKEALERATDYNDRLSSLVIFCAYERTRDEMRILLGLSSSSYFRQRYLSPLLKSGKIRMIMPDKPTSKYQKYIKA